MAIDLGNLKIGTQVDTSGLSNGLSEVQSKISSAGGDISKGMEKIGSTMTGLGAKISLGVTTPIVGMTTAMMKTGIEFESSMAQVSATMGYTVAELNDKSSEAAQNYAKLEAKAREMGASTKFSAMDAAEGLNYMALAGYDADQACQALPNVLNLAAAGGMDLATTSDMVTDSLSALGLSIDDMQPFMDKMAKASQKSNTSVEQLGNAILTVGGTAKTLSGGVVEMNTALGVLADNGIKGSEGGTALRNVILSLTAPTDKAAGLMAELGLQIADAQGNMRPLNEIMADLDSKLVGLGKAEKQNILNQLFNKVDLKSVSALMASTTMNMGELNEAFKSMGIDVEANSEMLTYLAASFEKNEDKVEFMNYAMQEMNITSQQASLIYDELNRAVDSGSDRFSQLSAMIADSEGACASMAETMSATSQGGIDSLNSAIGELSIKVTQSLKPIFDSIVEKLINLVGFLNNLSDESMAIITVIAAVAAAIGPLLVIIGTLITNISTIITVVSSASAAITAMGGVMALITSPISIAIASITAFVAATIYLYNTNEEVRKSIDTVWKSIKECIKAACDAIKVVISTFVDVVTKLWQKYGDNLMDIIEAAWKYVSNIFKTTFDLLTDLFNVFSKAFQGDWKGCWEAVKTLFKNLWDNIVQLLISFLDLMVDSIVNIGGVLLDAGVTIFTKFWEGIKSVWDNIMNWIDKVKENPVKAFTDIGSSMYNAGKNILSSLWDGLKSAWSNVESWFTDKMNWIKDKVTFWNNSKSQMSSDGSHRNGLAEVPFDGYRAILHKGERVLTQAENMRYTKQLETASQPVNYNITTDTSKLENLLTQLNTKLDRLPKNLRNESRLGFA